MDAFWLQAALRMATTIRLCTGCALLPMRSFLDWKDFPSWELDSISGSSPTLPARFYLLLYLSLTETIRMKTGTADTTTGVLRAIFWLRPMGRRILADKMQRELLYADSMGQNRTQNQDSGALSTK